MLPKPGDIIYMDTELYLSHGEDDIIGGRAEIQEVEIDGRYVWIIFKLFPDCKYSWAQLEPIQERLKNEFGLAWAHAKPDTRPEFNDYPFGGDSPSPQNGQETGKSEIE